MMMMMMIMEPITDILSPLAGAAATDETFEGLRSEALARICCFAGASVKGGLSERGWENWGRSNARSWQGNIGYIVVQYYICQMLLTMQSMMVLVIANLLKCARTRGFHPTRRNHEPLGFWKPKIGGCCHRDQACLDGRSDIIDRWDKTVFWRYRENPIFDVQHCCCSL